MGGAESGQTRDWPLEQKKAPSQPGHRPATWGSGTGKEAAASIPAPSISLQLERPALWGAGSFLCQAHPGFLVLSFTHSGIHSYSPLCARFLAPKAEPRTSGTASVLACSPSSLAFTVGGKMSLGLEEWWGAGWGRPQPSPILKGHGAPRRSGACVGTRKAAFSWK